MIKITFTKTAKANSANRYGLLLKIQPYCNGKVVTMRAKSNIYVDDAYFDTTLGVKPQSKKRLETKENAAYHREQSIKLQMLVSFIQERFDETDRGEMDCKWLANVVNDYYQPSKDDILKTKTFFDFAEDYLRNSTFASHSVLQFKATFRMMYRFEKYIQATKSNDFRLDIAKLTNNDLEDFRYFLRNEKELREKNPALFNDIKSQYPAFLGRGKESTRQRGCNSIVNAMNYLKTFWSWILKQEFTSNNPFKKFEIGSLHFGTPYYITLKQLHTIAKTTMPTKSLERYRDIFVFQCYVGCRVSDLARFTFDNIVKRDIGYCLEYTPHKTHNRGLRASTPRVPLKPLPLKLIAKYKGQDKHGRLFPNIHTAVYDDKIKQIFTIAGITNKVKVRNVITGDEEWEHINKKASSHMARRTFIGNIYNNGCPDPNIIGKMTGHAYNSKSFASYRTVEDNLLLTATSCFDDEVDEDDETATERELETTEKCN